MNIDKAIKSYLQFGDIAPTQKDKLLMALINEVNNLRMEIVAHKIHIKNLNQDIEDYEIGDLEN